MKLHTALAAMIAPALVLAIVLILNDPWSANAVPSAMPQPVPPTVTHERIVPVVILPAPTTTAPTTAAPVAPPAARKASKRPPAQVQSTRAVQAPPGPGEAQERTAGAEDGSDVPRSFYDDYDPNYRPPSKRKAPTTSREMPTTSNRVPTSSSTPQPTSSSVPSTTSETHAPTDS